MPGKSSGSSNQVHDSFVVPVCHEEIKVLYKDSDILIIDKPSGLLSLSGKNPLNKDSVHFRLVQDFPSALLAHRLDFGTSGIMLVALSKVVNACLTKQFQARTVKKTYTAVLDGHLFPEKGEIDMPVARDPMNFPVQKICHDTGKQAISAYKVIERLNNPIRTRVLFEPITGRTHQLRIHSREIGHSILGCDLYGSASTQAMSSRLLLHASAIEFAHPVSGEQIKGCSPCPF